jgi:hypothetical protein
MDANERITRIHAGPRGEGRSSIVDRKRQEPLTPSPLPNFAIRLADL